MPALNLSTTILTLSGLLALAIGVRGLLAPGALGAGLGFGIPGVDALNEVRAQYGGFFLTVAVVSGLAVFNLIPRQAALILLAATFGGVLLGRLFSLTVDAGLGGFSPTIRALYVIDAVGLSAALWALRVSD
jgi:hypothetical protein